MRIHLLAWALALAALPAAADGVKLRIELLHGHTIYREQVREAGIASGLTLSVNDEEQAAVLTESCERLRTAANLPHELPDGLRLQILFVVPRKGVSVEGYYFSADRDLTRAVLKAGRPIARPTLDGIVASAGLPPVLLEDINVEQEISCHVDEPLWVIAWLDVRPIGDQRPEAVINTARLRFMAMHRKVAEYAAEPRVLARGVRSGIDPQLGAR